MRELKRRRIHMYCGGASSASPPKKFCAPTKSVRGLGSSKLSRDITRIGVPTKLRSACHVPSFSGGEKESWKH